MAKGSLIAAGLVLIAAGGALAGFGTTRNKTTGGMTPEASSAMSSAIGGLDGDIKAARAKVHERAATIGGEPQVKAGVATDHDTVAQMVTDHGIAFNLEPDEVIEIGQTLNGQPPMALLVQPNGSMRSAYAGKAGNYTEMMGDSVLVTDVTTVVPADRASELSGYVMVSQRLDLKPRLAKLEAAQVVGKLVIGGATYPVGTPAPGSTEKAMPLESVTNAQFIVDSPPVVSAGDATTFFAGGGGIGGVGLILLIVGLVTGKRGAQGAQQPSPSQPGTQSGGAYGGVTPAQFGTAATQMSGPSAGPLTQNTNTPMALDTTAGFSSANLGPGAVLGRWEILKRLGSGGMADVYLARARGEAGFAKQVAIKVMHPHLARNDRAVEHFLDEARLAAQISHPNVVQIQDLGKIGNDYVIVMDYVDGVDLERLLASARAAQRPVPVDVGLAILARICDGLDAAHRATSPDGAPMNLVHRDVKAANVLVSRQGAVKVVDFGIAKAASQSHMTIAGETKGTPSMMAPEQRVGDVVDVRADVYSVAAVAYEILTGHNVNLDVAALAHLGIENWPHLPLPTTQRAQLPAELDSVIIGALAFERDRRPPTVAALGAAFEGVMKRNGLSVTDKDIARWVSGELDRLAA